MASASAANRPKAGGVQDCDAAVIFDADVDAALADRAVGVLIAPPADLDDVGAAFRADEPPGPGAVGMGLFPLADVRFCVRRRRHVGIFEFTPGSLDFSNAISSAVTGSKQVWRLDTGVMSRGMYSPGAKQRSLIGGDQSGIESASTCQIAACSNSRQRHCRYGGSGRSGVRSRRDFACSRRPDEYRTNSHLDDGPGSYGNVVCQPNDESGAAKRIRITASEPRLAERWSCRPVE
jgi:hypothetical protein